MVEENKKRQRPLKVLTMVLSSLLALETMWVSRAGVVDANRIEEVQAQTFLATKYFPDVLEDPDRAMNDWGTPAFQKFKQGKGLENYRKWYRPVRAIPPNNVTLERVADSPDTFTVSIKRLLKKGGSDRRSITTKFVCVSRWQAHAPGKTCSSDNIRLDYTHAI